MKVPENKKEEWDKLPLNKKKKAKRILQRMEDTVYKWPKYEEKVGNYWISMTAGFRGWSAGIYGNSRTQWEKEGVQGFWSIGPKNEDEHPENVFARAKAFLLDNPNPDWEQLWKDYEEKEGNKTPKKGISEKLFEWLNK